MNFYEFIETELEKDLTECYFHLSSIASPRHSGSNYTDVVKSAFMLGGTDEREKISYIFNKYPFLKGHCLVIVIPSGEEVPPHIDNPGRNVSLNILISGAGSLCQTSFYDGTNVEIMKSNDPTDTKITRNNSVLTVLDSYHLTKGKIVLTDTTTLHGISNHSDSDRISISWTLKFETLEEAILFFKNYEQ